MTVVVDTNVVLAALDPHDEEHARALAWYDLVDEDLVTTPLAVAEMDYLVARRSGRPGTQLLMTDLEAGALQVRWWATAMIETLAIARRWPELGLTDASLLALAPVVRTDRIATFDRRHFDAPRTADGDHFTLLP
ncbi:MAG: PIN domain-containing protein [Solirubrobacterales bacterium]|nr:PIN domain-containing protein [Solirubrobacterales bacterium]